jgi:hypothetical protein
MHSDGVKQVLVSGDVTRATTVSAALLANQT